MTNILKPTERMPGACVCRDKYHGHNGRACGSVGEDYMKEGWPDSLVLCPTCADHPADKRIAELEHQARHAQTLVRKNRILRVELTRLQHARFTAHYIICNTVAHVADMYGLEKKP